jgi:hypothetical protein
MVICGSHMHKFSVSKDMNLKEEEEEEEEEW